MALPKLTKLELEIMEALWSHGASSVREIQEAFPEKDRPAYTTVQTMVYRLEAKKALRRIKKIGNANIFEAVVSRASAQRRLIDELLSFFGGRTQPVVAHLIESGKLTLEDVKEAEQTLKKLGRSAGGSRDPSTLRQAQGRPEPGRGTTNPRVDLRQSNDEESESSTQRALRKDKSS